MRIHVGIVLGLLVVVAIASAVVMKKQTLKKHGIVEA
jgi:hypothetical protein